MFVYRKSIINNDSTQSHVYLHPKRFLIIMSYVQAVGEWEVDSVPDEIPLLLFHTMNNTFLSTCLPVLS